MPRKYKVRKVLDKATKDRIDKIFQIMTDFYGVSREDVTSKKVGKGNEISKVRTMLCYKFKEHMDLSWGQVGEMMNMTDQGVVFAIERMQANPELMQEFMNVIGEE